MPVQRIIQLLPLVLAVAGCATRPAPVAVVADVPPPIVAAAPFAGYSNIVVPPRLPDGSFATPNRNVSAAAAIWHLRAGLNVAALGCRGADEAVVVAGYNALLAAHRAEFAAAYRTLGAEYGAVDGFDQAMTRLYNYYALPPAQPGLCRAAAAILADGVAMPARALGDFAPAALARLDAPYVAIFTAQEAWLANRYTARTQVAAAPRLAFDTTVLSLP